MCTIIVTQVTVVFAGLIVETSIPCHPSLSLIWKYHCIRTCLNTRLQNCIVNAHTTVHVYKSAIIYIMYGIPVVNALAVMVQTFIYNMCSVCPYI